MKIKNLLFRADSGDTVGWGHTMRCFSLAKKFQEKNFKISFIVRKYPNNLSNFLEKEGFDIFYLNDKQYYWKSDAKQTQKIIQEIGDIDFLIMDNYKLNIKWEKFLKPHVKKLIVIDDMTLRNHECDLLLDQNYYENTKKLYSKLIPKECRLLMGPKFALIRDEFYQKRQKLKKRNGEINRILVSFGGSNPIDDIIKTINGIKGLKNNKIKVDLLIPNSNKYDMKIQKLFSKFVNITIHHKNFNMSELMNQSDLSIGAGGSSTWERCCLGLPSIVSIFAKNQVQLTEEMAKNGFVINLGMSKKISSQHYTDAIKNLNKSSLYQMSKFGLKLVDGKGTTRVKNEILNLL